MNVAESFSSGKGLIWTLKSSYLDIFRLVIGINVTWISCFKNESEVLLYNQYLPIISTRNFENNIKNNIDHLIYTLKSYKNKIVNKQKFYKNIGLKENKKNWIPLIKNHPSLCMKTEYDKYKTILHRIIEELEITDDEIIKIPEYTLLKSKWEVMGTFNNILKLKMNTKYIENKEAVSKYFDISLYKLVNTNNGNNKLFKYNDSIQINPNQIYEIYLLNKNLKRLNKFVLFQKISLKTNNYFYKNLKTEKDKYGVWYLKFDLNKNDDDYDLTDNDLNIILKSKYILKYNDDDDNDEDEEYGFCDIDRFCDGIPLKKEFTSFTLFIAPFISSKNIFSPKIVKTFSYKETDQDNKNDDDEDNKNDKGYKDFGKNGLFYFLGTNLNKNNKYKTKNIRNKIKIKTSKGMRHHSYKAYNLIGRDKIETATKNKEPSFFYINLGEYAFKPTHYTLRHGYWTSGGHMQYWQFEVSNNLVDWIILKKHENDASLSGGYKSCTYKLDINNDKFYKYFRIYMNGTNISNRWDIRLSGMEFYGTLYVIEEYEYGDKIFFKQFNK